MAQTVEKLPEIQKTYIQSLGQEDPLKKGMLPISVFLPKEFHGQEAWQAIVHGITKSQTWLQLKMHAPQPDRITLRIWYLKLHNYYILKTTMIPGPGRFHVPQSN